MSPAQKPPQRIEALSTNSSKPATIIFLHGYGDDADGLMSSSTFYFPLFCRKNYREGSANSWKTSRNSSNPQTNFPI
jgi:predicted esterase